MELTCILEECSKPRGKGSQKYCTAHYKSLWRAGLLERKRAPHGQRTVRKCSAEGCEGTAGNGGSRLLCAMHYQRMKKNGTFELKKFAPNDEIKQQIILDYKAGESTYYIGKLHNLSSGKVQYWLTKWGVNKRLAGFQPGIPSCRLKERKTDGFGYVLIYKPEHPNASRGFVREHRLVMEDVLGRYLTKEEIVHHINNNPSDNRPENLEVASRADHTRDHRLEFGHLTNDAGRLSVITLSCQCCGKQYKRKIIKLCRPCRAPPHVA